MTLKWISTLNLLPDWVLKWVSTLNLLPDWVFTISIDLFFRPHSRPKSDSACNRNECQGSLLGVKGGRCLGLTTLRSSCADCLKIREASVSWSPRGLSRSVQESLYTEDWLAFSK